MKEIKVTDDFLDLDLKTRKCQNIESYEACTTRLYLQNVKDECQCIPYNLLNFTTKEQVKTYVWFSIFTFCQIICSPIGNVCAGNISKEYDECLPPCEGIYADVTKIAADNVVNGDYYEALLMDYNRFKRFNYLSESKLAQ